MTQEQQTRFWRKGEVIRVALAGDLSMGDITSGSLLTEALVNKRREAGFHALNVAPMLFVFIFDPSATDATHLCPSTLPSGMERLWTHVNERLNPPCANRLNDLKMNDKC